MKELIVIIDVSGSMYAMGKVSVVGNVLSTLSALENLGDETEKISLTKMQWAGTCEEFEKLTEKCSGKNTLLITDGYALSDNCRTSRVAKLFTEKNRDNFFVILCGGDAMKICALKEFHRIRAVNADNVLYAVESLVSAGSFAENKAEESGGSWA